MKDCLTYDDVLLIPQYSDIRSKSHVDISPPSQYMTIPIFSAPMDTVTEDEMAIALYNEGGRGVVHRYNTIERQVEICKLVLKQSDSESFPVYGAIGVTGDCFERAEALIEHGVSSLCIDVAHGHHILVKESLKQLRSMFGNSVEIMAGNVATLEGFNALADWGANSVRCNIGGGSICSTRIQTGHGMPGLQTIMDCARSDRDAIIIADGGIRNSGDIVKALAAGADAIMLGSLLAGTNEAPGKTISGRKIYRGMASKEAQNDWRGKYSSIEGIQSSVACNGSVKSVIDELCIGIQSGFSYSGARNITELQSKAKFVRQTSAGGAEGKTHIETR